jgi:hypothetical protein
MARQHVEQTVDRWGLSSRYLAKDAYHLHNLLTTISSERLPRTHHSLELVCPYMNELHFHRILTASCGVFGAERAAKTGRRLPNPPVVIPAVNMAVSAPVCGSELQVHFGQFEIGNSGAGIDDVLEPVKRIPCTQPCRPIIDRNRLLSECLLHSKGEHK